MELHGAVMMNRITPCLGAEYYKTYSERAPLATHWRPATCEEYECEAFLRGFFTTIDTSSELGQAQYHFLTHDPDRSYFMQRIADTIYRFTYGPGNKCMKWDEHRVPVGRPPLYLVSGGDWRGNPRGTPTVRHRTVENWVEDFSEHQDRIATSVQRG